MFNFFKYISFALNEQLQKIFRKIPIFERKQKKKQKKNTENWLIIYLICGIPYHFDKTQKNFSSHFSQIF